MNRILRAGIVLGLGIGGFFDGIVLHQILGWHQYAKPRIVSLCQSLNWNSKTRSTGFSI